MPVYARAFLYFSVLEEQALRIGFRVVRILVDDFQLVLLHPGRCAGGQRKQDSKDIRYDTRNFHERKDTN